MFYTVWYLIFGGSGSTPPLNIDGCDQFVDAAFDRSDQYVEGDFCDGNL